jgi:hypothetical protein
MRLLHAETLQFGDFSSGTDMPRYAILSHRWLDEELSFHDMRAILDLERQPKPSDLQNLSHKQGYRKIYDFRCRALQDGYEYIWVDTCCIDKSSSAELQEAINSMYQWYRDAGACYVFLSDVFKPDGAIDEPDIEATEASWIKDFKRSKWFTRGWTLQELLAPRSLVFFDGNWKRCGTLHDLQTAIRQVTGIDVQTVIADLGADRSRFWSIRAGRRIFWASHRQTTRLEDEAYALLGILDVNIPLLYGEGPRAFQRLQEEIIKVAEDISILAWSCTEDDGDFAPNGLARSPARFRSYSKLIQSSTNGAYFVAFSPVMIARGLQTELQVQKDPHEERLAYAILMYEHREALVLPIFFPALTFTRSLVKNECVRFSDPLWVPLSVVKNAAIMSVCFIRQVQAVYMGALGDGLSISSTVWRDYVTTFTYPLQTQSSRRHFPAIAGGFSHIRSSTRAPRRFVLELRTRTAPWKRFVVVAEYKLGHETKARIRAMTTTVLKMQRCINLADAIALVQNPQIFEEATVSELCSRDGKAIPNRDILLVRQFSKVWVNEKEID